MLKFMRSKGHHLTAERLKLHKELFNFVKTVPHGFPHRPSSLAYDPKLQLLAIGTRIGQVRIYGAAGVEFEAQHKEECHVTGLYFLNGQGRLITQCDDSSLHLFEINEKEGKWVLEEVKHCSLEGRLKKVTTCCLKSSGEHLLIGTDGGNIYLLDVKTFEMTDQIIYQDIVMQNVPDDYKLNPGSVEAIAEHPLNPNKILIGYNRGLMVLWDNSSLNSENTYIGNQQLESVDWSRSGKEFVSSHNDGSYVIWSSTDSSKSVEGPNTPYGPFPCKAITKVLRKSVKGGDNMIIFSGGMPRASYGDRHTVTLICGEKHQVLDFTSKVIDFVPIMDVGEDSVYDNPHTLIVLAEEELVVIDLESEDWLPFRLPYMSSLHSSAITCSQHYSDVPQDLWNRIVTAGNTQVAGKYTEREFPITGGIPEENKKTAHDMLLTGHEDGTIRFWDASGVALSHLYTLHTSNLFVGEDAEPTAVEEEEWPAFRKVGSFDPYSDDPRLAVKKILLCVYTHTLMVAGTAGQVVLFDLKEDECEKEVEGVSLNIVSDRDNFVWKGHDELAVKKGSQKFGIGYQPFVITQLSPPAAITAVALHSDWGLIAAGTAHGFGLFDYVQKKVVMSKCTLNPSDLLATGDATMSRRKSFKKSLRESFRRLRKGRSQRGKRDKTPTRQTEEPKPSPPKEAGDAEPAAGEAGMTAVSTPVQESKPVERQVEARSADDSLGSMVRCLYLDQSFIINNTMTTSTLWAGTNAGAIYVFTLSRPQKDKRDTDAVACQLGKEIQLKHRAPVIAIQIVDGAGHPLPKPHEVENEKAKAADLSGYHRVLICSEEQFKMFTLPSLKPYCKFKLTAHEGARVRKVGIIDFKSKSDENYVEHVMACLSNQGEIGLYSIPDLRRQQIYTCLKREDINGICSVVFTRFGEGFYLQSSCEMRRFSLSAKYVTRANFKIELPEGARPVVVPEEETKAEEMEVVKEVEQQQTKTEELKEDLKSSTDTKKEEAKKDEGADDDSKTEDKLNISENKPDANMSQDEDRKDLDITVDSVKDHLANLTTEVTTEIVTAIENEVNSKIEKASEMVKTSGIMKAAEVVKSNEIVKASGIMNTSEVVKATEIIKGSESVLKETVKKNCMKANSMSIKETVFNSITGE